MVDFGKIVRRERRLAAISRCMDEIASVKNYDTTRPGSAILNTLGQLDWLEELHRLLYEDHT